MQYVSNTDKDRAKILKTIGVSNFEALLKDIPKKLRVKELHLSEGISEMELLGQLKKIGQQNSHSDRLASFMGAGVYDHYIPSLVNQLVTRGEFITAYTPYQGEASQGTLQTIYEYQTMICMLTGMDVSNASMYDGASCMAEAVLMAIRSKKGKKIFISETVHPEYIDTVKTYISKLDVEVVLIPQKNGVTDVDALKKTISEEAICTVIQNPNFFGYLENADEISNIAHENGALSIASVNPISLGLIKSPGDSGVDIALGEGQPLGNSIAYGGPHFGFLAVKKEHMRKLPGRIAGLTKDKEGNDAYVLTLQAREQHIRREKATSNICTNHALCALKGLVFLAVLGPHGFERMGQLNVEKSHEAHDALRSLSEVSVFSDAPFFNEFTIRIDKDPESLKESWVKHKLLGPLHLGRFGEQFKQHYLVATTEQRTSEEIERLAKAIREA